MKCLMAVVAVPLIFASCAQPLQKLVDEDRSQRMSDVYGNAPVTYGAADGIGTSHAQAHAIALTEEAPPAGH